MHPFTISHPFLILFDKSTRNIGIDREVPGEYLHFTSKLDQFLGILANSQLAKDYVV